MEFGMTILRCDKGDGLWLPDPLFTAEGGHWGYAQNTDIDL